MREKIFLSFLTGISLQTLLEGEYDFSIFADTRIFEVAGGPVEQPGTAAG
jgi:hypothetical protein